MKFGFASVIPIARPRSGFSARVTARDATGVFFAGGGVLDPDPPQAASVTASAARERAGERVMTQALTRPGGRPTGRAARGDLLLLGPPEGGAAATGRDDVGVVDLEA